MSNRQGNCVSNRQGNCVSNRQGNCVSNRQGDCVSNRQGDCVSNRQGNCTSKSSVMQIQLRPNHTRMHAILCMITAPIATALLNKKVCNYGNSGKSAVTNLECD